jgi:hypothetical protein
MENFGDCSRSSQDVTTSRHAAESATTGSKRWNRSMDKRRVAAERRDGRCGRIVLRLPNRNSPAPHPYLPCWPDPPAALLAGSDLGPRPRADMRTGKSWPALAAAVALALLSLGCATVSRLALDLRRVVLVLGLRGGGPKTGRRALPPTPWPPHDG